MAKCGINFLIVTMWHDGNASQPLDVAENHCWGFVTFYLASIIFSPLNTFLRKGKDREPDPDPYL
jgi:hypothetical protein